MPSGQKWPGEHETASSYDVNPWKGQEVPAAHNVQSGVEVPAPPVATLKVPGGQGEGEIAPAAQKWPAGHAVHAPPCSEYYPATQAVGAFATLVQSAPGGHTIGYSAPSGQ